MSQTTDTHDGSEDSGGTDASLKGWDKGAFWYPTLDRRGALLGLFFVLLLLHFDEIFGIAGSTALVFDWLPATMAYHIGINVLHVAFMVLIYLNWPEPTDKDLDQPGVATSETSGEISGTATVEGE